MRTALEIELSNSIDPGAATRMKAAVRSGYGSPSILRVEDVECPTPANDEVLVRVYATTVSRTDCHVLSGRPFMMRLFTGVLKPRVAVTGSDFAGKIEAVGKHVQSLKVGDRVMGFGGVFGSGSHAHYLAFPESKAIAIIPDNLTYEEAAACVEGAVYAFNGVSAVNPRRGHTALVNGATGAIGSSMVQLLKYQGVSVTAVCRGEHGALVRSLGAERVIDYRTEDFTKGNGTYDLVLDAVGTSTFGRCKPILNDTGVYTSSGGLQNLLLALTTPLLGGKKVAFPPPRGMRASLGFVRDLAERGSFTAVIDRRFPLDKIAEAFEYVATGNKVGNVIITLDS